MARLPALALLLTLLLPASAVAVDGISVTVHWSGENRMFWGGFGEIWTHEIRDSVVVERSKIYDGPARMVVMSPTGKKVAFIKEDGTVAIMGIRGGEVTDLAQAHPEGGLDWPHPDWIYFSTGGWSQYDTSRYIYRVNPNTGVEESVTVLDCGIWRVHISADLTRAVFRAVSGCSSAGSIVSYDLATNDGILRPTRATDSPSCGEAFDPRGEFFTDGMPSHQGFDIRRWDNLDIVDTFLHTDAAQWGGPDSGANHNRNGWAVNSQDWICVHLGWDVHHGSSCPGANQVLYNWVLRERIVVTENTYGSYTFDSAGDFWVGVANEKPEVYAGPDRVVSLASPTTLVGLVQDDGEPGPLTLSWEAVDGPGTATFATPNAAETEVSFSALGDFTLRLTASDGDRAGWDDVQVSVADNGAPVVSAGDDITALAGEDVMLSAAVVDDGLPNGAVVVHWSQLSGPPGSVFTTPDNVATLAVLSELGLYEFRVSADDGELSASDTVEVEVVTNQTPVVSAGADVKLLRGTSVELTGEVDDDGFPEATTVVWSLLDGPDELAFSAPNALVTLATPGAEGDYHVRLAAHDSAAGSYDDLVVTVGPNAPPAVDAGADQTIPIGTSALLLGEVADDGLPGDAVTLAWSQVEGTGTVTLATPDAARTLAEPDQVGSYLLRLTANDGELEASDDVRVTVQEPASIQLLEPNGGEVWMVGATARVRWASENVDDVTISLSIDDGASWSTLVPTVDVGSASWGNVEITVPNEPSDFCRIAVAAYIDGNNRVVSEEVFSIVESAAPSNPTQRTSDGGCAAAPGSAAVAALLVAVRRRRSR